MGLENLLKLSGAIRELGIQGKLLPQNQDEESAHDLLGRIKIEKEALVKDKIIKKQKPLPEIEGVESPYKLPNNWVWVRMGELCHTVADGPHFSPKYVDKGKGIPFLSGRNINIDAIDLSSAKYVSKRDHEEFCRRVKPKKGDILYTKGGTTGIAKVNDIDVEFSVWVHVAVLQIPNDKINAEYLALALNSPHCYEQSQNYTHGIGNKDLGLTRMIKITVPLPPLEEQKRIVAKVDQLMAHCDQLEQQLTTAYSDAEKLINATIKSLVA